MAFLALALALSAFRTVSQKLKHEQTSARTDSLTGVANRRWFYEIAMREIERTKTHAMPLTVAYFDLDGFKQLNDYWGHDAGDDVLREVGAILNNECRDSDLAARMGGDEFILLLPKTDVGTARAVTDRIVARLHHATHRNGWRATVSTGAVTFLRPPLTADEVVKLADASMYAAKRNGRNRIEFQTVRN